MRGVIVIQIYQVSSTPITWRVYAKARRVKAGREGRRECHFMGFCCPVAAGERQQVNELPFRFRDVGVEDPAYVHLAVDQASSTVEWDAMDSTNSNPMVLPASSMVRSNPADVRGSHSQDHETGDGE